MKNSALEQRIQDEILAFIHHRKSLLLASSCSDGSPYASYAPFAIGDDCLYVLLSDIAVHAVNLRQRPAASVLIIEDEDSAAELFARLRVNYQVSAEHIAVDSDDWQRGIACLAARHGERIQSLSQLADFKLFRLQPHSGRYVKGFGKAYAFSGPSLLGTAVDHLRDGHKKRA